MSQVKVLSYLKMIQSDNITRDQFQTTGVPLTQRSPNGKASRFDLDLTKASKQIFQYMHA